MLSYNILLEGQESGDEYDEEGDEVFGLKGLSEEDSADSENEYEDDVEERPQPKDNPQKSKAKKSIAKEPSDSENEESEEEETWGRSKAAYYSSNAAQLESDDEEANALEEQEAKRLQAKARDALCEGDFGLDDPVPLTEPSPYVAEPLPQLEDKQALIRHLEKNSPETLALARDWDDTAWNLVKTREKNQNLEARTPDALTLGMVHLHYQVLLTYATTLAFFLHMRSSDKYAQRPELLKSHPVFLRLLTLKQSLSTLEDLDIAVSDEESDVDDDESLSLNDEETLDKEQLWTFDQPSAHKPPKKKRKMDSSGSANGALPIFDLVEPVYGSPKSTSRKPDNDPTDIDAYGEATSLHHADQADKNARKKSLRFHISKIASASARRQGARNNRVGGDDDIPYRERRKEQVARLANESEKKAEDGSGDDAEEDVDGYYKLIERKTKEKKAKKKADYEEAQAAARPDFEDATVTGPRSLTRAILTNKGLTPHRSKSVRNPRVKKRQKFEKAKKKVSSQKAVYKGGIGNTGRYDGEKSGISKVVKSVRLG